MLVENYLFAIVSLPAGVFQPNSSVKTTKLLMDKSITKKTNIILCVKIENDGYDLGAQRREIDKNDLPDALSIVLEYKQFCHSERSEESKHPGEWMLRFAQHDKNMLIVPKEKIAASKDYNLSIDRYMINDNIRLSMFEMVRL